MTKRKPDPLWDVAVELCDGGGSGPITQSERGKWNKGIAEIRRVGGTPEQLRTAIAAYKRRNKGCACNPLAIAGQWGRLMAEGQPSLSAMQCAALEERWYALPFKRRQELTDALGLSSPAELAGHPHWLRQALEIWDKEQKP